MKDGWTDERMKDRQTVLHISQSMKLYTKYKYNKMTFERPTDAHHEDFEPSFSFFELRLLAA